MEYLLALLVGGLVGAVFACGMAGVAWLVKKFLGESRGFMLVGFVLFGIILYLVLSPILASLSTTDPAMDLIIGVVGYMIGLVIGAALISSLKRPAKQKPQNK